MNRQDIIEEFSNYLYEGFEGIKKRSANIIFSILLIIIVLDIIYPYI
jgi:hypothetical protein